jgi:hypothetical protein
MSETKPLPETKSAVELVMRGLRQHQADKEVLRHSAADPLEAFQKLLAIKDYPQREPVIEWNDPKNLCLVDVDWHGEEKPSEYTLRQLAGSLAPSPNLWWPSHGGGLKLAYKAKWPLDADELAALAVLMLRKQWISPPWTGIETATRTRHPHYPRGNERAGEVHRAASSRDADDVRQQLLGNARGDVASGEEQDAVEQWLEENGWQQGKRYPHHLCPIAPEHQSDRDPVTVLDWMIYCYACAGRGRCFRGMKKPGIVPVSFLMDRPVSPGVGRPLRNAVRGMAHWAHARHILEAETFATGEHGEKVYRALLKLWHLRSTDMDSKRAEALLQLIDRVFWDSPIVRAESGWVHADDLATPAAKDGLALILQSLSAVQSVGPKGGIKVSSHKLGMFLGGFDLTRHGYPPIQPLRGMDVAERIHFDPSLFAPPGQVYAVLPADPPFVYRSKDKRDLAHAEKVLSDSFPGVRLDVLRLLIAAKGIIQRGDCTESPKIFKRGQSGSAKTAHALLGAELCCDRVERGEFSANRERLLQNYADLSRAASFVLFDEIDKAKVSDAELVAGLLSLVKDKNYHQLYRGTRRITQPAVVLLADTRIPDALVKDVQAARRIVLVDLGAGLNAQQQDGKPVDWRRTCGSGSIEGWRRQPYLPDCREAADTLVSEVMDRFFCCSGVTFTEIAHELGFKLLSEQAQEGIDTHAAKRALFFAACRAADCKDSNFKGRGWKVFEAQTQAPLAAAFREALDNSATAGDPKAWQELTGAQWGNVLGCPGVEFDVHKHGRRIGLRFRLGDPRGKEVRYNAEIPVAVSDNDASGPHEGILPFAVAEVAPSKSSAEEVGVVSAN